MNNFDLHQSILKYKNEIDFNFQTAISYINHEFEFKSIPFTELEINKIEKIQNVIYYIEIQNFKENESKSFLNFFQKFKNTHKKIKLPQLNFESKSNILYVGKSSTDFKTRINYHYGDKSLSTYSLHYQTWCDKDEFKHLKLRVHYFQFQKPIHKDILEIIESALHLKLNPLLGRSGH